MDLSDIGAAWLQCSTSGYVRFNTENRLISVNVTGQALPTLFIYDGDGNLVKKIKQDNSKTLYVGGIYEVDKNSGGAETGTKTYYPAAGAMRNGSTLYYVLKDHLGSASVVTDSTAQANVVGEDRFYPFGETRLTTGTMFTDRLFTGQRQIAELGIYHYGARFYSPKLGRFLSADTIVPGFANPQNLNRFSYVINNPLRYTDPTGHSETDGCQDYGCGSSTPIDYDYDPIDNNDDEDETVITLTRDELDEVQDSAAELADFYEQQGDWWAWGTGAVVGVGMLVVDGLSCAGAVGTAGILTAGCVGAIYLTAVGVPALAVVAGELGGHAASDDASTLSGYINESLADNPELNEITLTITTNTHTEVILPGGVGPTYTSYSVQITGVNSSVVLSGYAGDDVISALFGITP